MANEEYKQLSIFDMADMSIAGGYEKWPEGSTVRNTCNNKEYTLKRDEGDIAEVFDKDKGYLIMAKADLEMVSAKKDGIFFWEK